MKAYPVRVCTARPPAFATISCVFQIIRGSWMIVAPGSLARKASARSPTTYSPSIKVPVWSKKKQRSKSPSQATPKSAPVVRTAAAVAGRF